MASRPLLQEDLARHAGKTVRLVLPGLAGSLSIDADGRVHRSGSEQTDARLHIPLDALMQWPVDRAAARSRIRVEGDRELALALAQVLAMTEWDAEELLSRLLGDVAAHRIMRVWHGRQDVSRDRWQRLAESVGEYIQYEGRWIVARPTLDGFNRDVDVLRDDVERLEKRIQRLFEGAE